MPFITMVMLLCLLLLLSLFKGQPWEQIILAVFFFATLIVGIEAAEREIIVTRDGLKMKKFFREKNFTWPEVTHLAILDLNKKAYFLLTTTKGFYFFSNMFENHALLLRSIVDMVNSEKVEIQVKNYLEHPQNQHYLIVICWLTVLVIIFFIILKLLLA